jgi:hypothetical protein
LALDLMLCGLANPAEVTRELLVPADTLVPVGRADAAMDRETMMARLSSQWAKEEER